MVTAQIINFPEPVSVLDLARFEPGKVIRCPLFLNRMSAGFPSPADDYIEEKLSLDERFIERPSSTFFFTVSGDSMEPRISNGDLLVVDRSLADRNVQGKVVVAVVDGEFTVKRYFKKDNNHILVADNPSYPEKVIKEGNSFYIWGVVKNVVKSNL